jgi:uncharacterized membrane protein YkvA (DUF1232 family)
VKIQVKEHVSRHQPWTVLSFVRHLPNFVRLFFRLLGDSRVGGFAKTLLIGAAVYAVSPLDFIPDLFPMLGQVDDLTIFIMACRMFIQLSPKEVVAEHVQRLDQSGGFRPFNSGQ